MIPWETALWLNQVDFSLFVAFFTARSIPEWSIAFLLQMTALYAMKRKTI